MGSLIDIMFHKYLEYAKKTISRYYVLHKKTVSLLLLSLK